MVDYEKLKELLAQINLNDSVCIVTSYKSDYDIMSFVVFLSNYLRSKKVNTTILVNKEVRGHTKSIFKRYQATYRTSLESSDYKIRIKYIKDGVPQIKNAKHDIEGDEFVIYLTPTPNSKFLFDDIQFEKANIYRHILVIGIQDVNKLGKLYSTNKSFFSSNNITYINRKPNTSNTSNSITNNGDPLSVLGVKLLEQSNNKNKELYQILFEGVLSYLQPMQKGTPNKSAIKTVSLLMQKGYNIKNAMFNLYGIDNLESIKLQGTVITNMKMHNQIKTISSVVTYTELDNVLKGKELDSGGKIPFNWLPNIDIAFVLYEIAKNTVYGVIECNNPVINVLKIISKYNYSGNTTRATFYTNGDITQTRDQILERIREIQGLEKGQKKEYNSNTNKEEIQQGYVTLPPLDKED